MGYVRLPSCLATINRLCLGYWNVGYYSAEDIFIPIIIVNKCNNYWTYRYCDVLMFYKSNMPVISVIFS